MSRDEAVPRRQLGILALVVAGMFAFAVLAMPPIYRVFCELTGLNGRIVPVPAAASREVVAGRSVEVELLTSVDAALPWTFASERRVLTVHPGEIHRVVFRVVNRGDSALTGRAVPSISPAAAASHLKKTQCFCFREQTLPAGAAVDMPVVFYLDPDLPAQIHTVTLAYRFYRQPAAGQG